MSESDKSENVGMSKEEYQKLRASLLGFSNAKLQEIVSMKDDQSARAMAFADWIQLNDRIHQIDLEYLQRYMVNVLEGLGKEARILRYLNITLIGLTVMLAVLTGILAFKH